jgi:hypothetical protein
MFILAILCLFLVLVVGVTTLAIEELWEEVRRSRRQ